MTSLVTSISIAESDILWRTWLARGAENDRRAARQMRRLLVLLAALMAVGLVVRFA